MRALLMGPEEERALLDLRTRAESNPVPLRRQFEALQTKKPIGDDAGHTILVPMGYWVSFTVDQGTDGLYRHLSVSVEGKRGMVPNEFAIGWIAERLGFKPNEGKEVYLENEMFAHPAVNWLQKC